MTGRIGRYDVVQPLDDDTFLAKATGLGGFDRLVVVKLAASGADRTRIVEEAKRVANLRHPNVLPIYDVGEHEDRVFVVVDYVPGATLAALAKDGVPKRVAARVLADALSGLEAIELHGSFGKKSILVGTDGVTRVTNLAIGTSADSSRAGDLRAAAITAWETLSGKTFGDDADEEEVAAPFTAAVAGALRDAAKTAGAFAKDLATAAREGGLYAEPEEVADHVKAYVEVEQKKRPIETPKELPVPPLPPKPLAVPDSPISVLALKVDLSDAVGDRANTALFAPVAAAVPAKEAPPEEPEVYRSPVAAPPSVFRRVVDHVAAWPKKKKELVGAGAAAGGALVIVLLFARCISSAPASAAADAGVEAAVVAAASASADDVDVDDSASGDPMALPPPPAPASASASAPVAQAPRKPAPPKEKRTWPKRGPRK